MMDRYLTKAKRSDNGEWVEGYVFKATEHWHNHGIHEDWIVTGAIQNGGWCNIYGKYPIDKNTICSYTGLNDKYGNKIFENSIIQILYEDNYSEIGFVKYSSCGVRYVLVIDGQTYRFDESCDIEVLGNRFDNKELLGGMEC